MTELLTSAAASSNSLPEAAQAVLRRQLDDGERLVWSGQPLPGKLAWAQLPSLLVAVPWTAFVVCFSVVAAREKGAALFLLPFFLVGVMLATAPWRAYRRASQTIYALTNLRALVVSPSTELMSIGRLDVVSYVPSTMSRSSNRDGSGDLVFSTVTTRRKGGEHVERKGFLGIANAFEVERLVRRELLSSSSSADR
jgi:hypothetical protein